MSSGQPGMRPPQQQRSRASLERVLSAGEKLLAEKGYEGFTISEVSRRSKVSVGSVYGRFENKDALFHAIHRRLLDRMAATAADDQSDGDRPTLDAAVRGGVHSLARMMDGERALLRVYMHRGAVDPAVSGPASEASRDVSRAFREAVLAHREEIGHPDPELAVDVSWRMAYDVLTRNVMYGPTFESDIEVEWQPLVEELIVAALAYLRHGPGPRTSQRKRKRR